jgi:HSP20 family molecular chaperone IbpA
LVTLVDDINRLFDELVRDPWSRARVTRVGAPPARPETEVDLEMPIAGGQLSDVSVSLQGRQLIVRAQRRPLVAGAADETTGSAEELERRLVLPETAEVSAIEARVTGEVLHVRVYLRSGLS